MLQLNNHTPLLAELHPTIDWYGRDFIVVIIKGTYRMPQSQGKLTIADKQVGVQSADDFYTEPGKSSVKLASDLALMKPATDVLVTGHAYAPGGYATQQCEVALSVGTEQRRLQIFGDRYWHRDVTGWAVSDPTLFERIPLVYENAYGGFDLSLDNKQTSSDKTAPCDPRNPCGKGFFVKGGQPVEGQALPNIEDPAALIQSASDRPNPAGFGAIARNWEPRVGLSGTYDQTWQQNRMPLLPVDFDPAFFNAAPQNLQFSPLLNGDEAFTLNNMSENGLISFALPNAKFAVTAVIRGQEKYFVPDLDTVLIQPDYNRVVLTWRAAVSCNGKLLYVDSISVNNA